VSDQGEPIEGASVYGQVDGPGGSTYDKAVTGADGAFRLQLGEGKGYVNVQHAPWNAYESREITVDGDGTSLSFTLHTPPPRTAVVEGRILGADGKPLENAVVRLEQGCCYAYERGGGVTYATPTASPPPPSDASDPAAGNGSSGSAGSAEGKAAPSEARVMPIMPCCYDDGQSVTTGPDGAYEFRTYGGPRMLYVEAKGYAQTSVQVDAKDGATVTRDVKMEKVPDKDAVLKGRVLDARTGAPIPNVQVSLANLEWSRYEYAVTAADGAYRIQTLPGWSQLSVQGYGYYGVPEPAILVDSAEGSAGSIAKPLPASGPSYYQTVVTLRLASGETTRDVKLEPKPEATVVLQGYVVDPDAKKGIPGAQVSVWNQDTGDWGNAVTDKTGSYKLLVRPGHYTANAWAEGHLAGGATFAIAEGESLKRVDLDTPKGETRYAPCDDCDGGYAMKGGVMYDAVAPAPTREEARAGGAPMAASDASTGSSAGNAANAPQAAGSTERGTAVYKGSGGGLPTYDPQASPETQASGVGGATTSDTMSQVPAPGALVAVLGIGLAALALAHRRRQA
jgi:protocatechuate 3,4-dioxygenase beta subunit